MRLNIHGKPIYQIGDVVMLVDKRPEGWSTSGDMDKYLNNIITITAISYGETEERSEPEGQLSFTGSSSWTFRINNIACIASPEIIKEYRQRRERELNELKEKFKTFVFKGDEVYDIAKDIFGEECVDIEQVSPIEFNVTVLFPEVNITNSRRNKHIMRDLYVKINVGINVEVDGDRISNIILSGRRGKLSEEEYQSNYGHSHFSGGGLERWSDFCLGSSDFAMILQTMKFSLTPEDWSLLFLSLGNYVSWESIEGGPYKNIQNIALRQDSYNTSDFRNHALELIKTLPNACLTLNDGKIEFNTDHPSLLEHYVENSRITSFRTGASNTFASMETRFNTHVRNECRTFRFKGTDITPVLYRKSAPNTVASTEPEKANIDQDVIEFYNRTISKELKKYNIHYEYNKISTSSTVFRASCPF